MKKKLSFFLSFSAVLLFSVPSFCVTINIAELADRLDQIESALKGVQKKLSNNYVGSAKRAGKSAVVSDAVDEDKLDGLIMQIQESEQTLKTLTGEVETLRYVQDELKEKIDRINADISVRFAEIEKRTAEAEAGLKKITDEKTAEENAKKAELKKQKDKEAAEVKAAKDKEKKIKDAFGNKKPKELYDEAFAAIKKQDFKKAQERFEAFLTLYPKDDLAGNAQYWLGESFFARSMYSKAAIAFAEGFQKYRSSQKAPDNLFKLGLTMSKLKKNEEACIAFKNFAKEYPKVSEAMQKRLTAEVKKLSCP